MKDYTHCGVKTLIPRRAFWCYCLLLDLLPSFTCLKKGMRSSKFGTCNVYNFSRWAYHFGISCNYLNTLGSFTVTQPQLPLQLQEMWPELVHELGSALWTPHSSSPFCKFDFTSTSNIFLYEASLVIVKGFETHVGIGKGKLQVWTECYSPSKFFATHDFWKCCHWTCAYSWLWYKVYPLSGILYSNASYFWSTELVGRDFEHITHTLPIWHMAYPTMPFHRGEYT